MTTETLKKTEKESAGAVVSAADAEAGKNALTFKHTPTDNALQNQRRSIIRKIEAAKEKNKNSGQLSFFDNMLNAEETKLTKPHVETLDRYLSLSNVSPEARALHIYIKSQLIAADIKAEGEKFSKMTINAHGEMYATFTKKTYSNAGRTAHQDYHRKLIRWKEALTEHAHLKFRTADGTSGISGSIYPRIELDAKSGKMDVYLMREYVEVNIAHGVNYDILPDALFTMANGTHAGALAYLYLHNYYNDRRHPKNADGTLKARIKMTTLADNCGVQNLDEAKANRHQKRDVKEPIINGLAEYRKAKVIDYILTLHGQQKTNAEAILLNDDDFESLRIEKVFFPGIAVKKLGKKPKATPEAKQMTMIFDDDLDA